MNFAKGNYEEAVRMCMEIIRQGKATDTNT